MKIFTFDTTLRDGTQGESVSFSVDDKLLIAQKLDELGIDYIEGGWPGSNPKDKEFFTRAEAELHLKHAKLTAFGATRFARHTVEEDRSVQSLVSAGTPVVSIFGKSWDLHTTRALGISEEENLKLITETVAYLKAHGKEVVYDAEHFFDGYKNNPEYALRTLEAARDAGAVCLTLCDTNGGTLVPEVHDITAEVVKHFPKTRIGLHCHNDAGLGVAVTLAGVEAGGTLVQGTINGHGERNGNANLTTILPNLALKMNLRLHCAGHLSELRDLSHFTDELANFRPDPKAPYVGATAFAHKGGVHADAANKVARSYEHIDPALVGNHTRVLVSDMAGKSSVMMKARELGLEIDVKSPKLKDFLAEVKAREFRGYQFEAADASFLLLLKRTLENWTKPFDVLGYRMVIEREGEGSTLSEATVKVKVGDRVCHEVAEDAGPVGALDRALRKALEPSFPALKHVHLADFNVRIVDTGQGAQAIIRVLVESTDGHESWGTVGASDNIIAASYEALCDSFAYKLLRDGQKK